MASDRMFNIGLAEAEDYDLDDPKTRAAVYRERGRDFHAGRHVDVAKAFGRALERAYQEGVAAAARPQGRRTKTAKITKLTLTPRPREAMDYLATWSDGGATAVVLRRAPGIPGTTFRPSWRMVHPARDLAFGETTLAQLRRLRLLVPYGGRDDALTLSQRALAFIRDGEVEADYDDSPSCKPAGA